jgi:pimeloyl-ACP methyl ester carboxylesterase
MFKRWCAGFALAFSLLASASAEPGFEVGALHVEVRGEGSPVILIPGLASGSWVWRDTATRLESRHTVYFLTLPGFDGRPARAGVTLDSLQQDLLMLIDTRRLERPVLVGHSLGGALSLAFATKHSASIAGVVSVDGLPVFPGTERASDRKALAEGMRAQFAAQTREQFAAGQRAYMLQIGTVDEARAEELAALAARSDVAATADFAAQIMALDLRPALAGIEVPVVLVLPFHAPDFARIGVDEAGKTAYYRGLMAGVRQLEVVSIAPARHFVMFDQPEKFAQALDRALADMKH